MTRQVLFNGAVLVRAGGASKVDASAFQNLGITGVGIVALVGKADEGEPSAVKAFTDPRAMVEEYGAGPLADAADLAFRPMNDTRVPGGAASVLAVKVNPSTQATLDLDASANAMLNLTTKRYGLNANKTTGSVATSGGGKVVEFKYENGAVELVETSPVLGATPPFTIQYTGAGSACTLTTTATAMTITATGAASDDFSLDYETYGTLQEVLNAIQQNANYDVVINERNPYGYDPADLDFVSSQDIKTSVYSVTDVLYQIKKWIDESSELVSAARPTGASEGTGAPDDLAETAFSGAVKGDTTNALWQAAFDLLGKVRANQVVALLSADGASPDTDTFASVAAMLDSHVAHYSSTAGKSEREGWLGMEGTKTEVLDQAGTLQSPHTLVTSQSVYRENYAGDLTWFPEWGLAVMAAGGRAGSVLGEPLVYKNLRCSGLDQDASWNPEDDGKDLILGGVTFAFQAQNGGFKFDRVVTTYTKLDNDAYVEESVVQGWKNVAYGLRQQLEDIYTGTRASPVTREGLLADAETILEAYRQEGQIVDSILEDGTVLNAFRDLSVTISGDIATLQATISPVSGINFQLHTLFLVPATIAG